MTGYIENEIIRYVARNVIVFLKDLENHISSNFGVSTKTAYYHISKLKNSGILRFRRTKDKKILVELDPKFIAFIIELYSYILRSNPDRVRYYEKKLE